MQLDFEKGNGLIPVIIQHEQTQQVLMLGYMNQEALAKTQSENKVTFFSRSKNRLWTKGETSGNYLIPKSIKKDCDSDTLLIQVLPYGGVCHTGQFSCFEEKNAKGFSYELEGIIHQRLEDKEANSYVNRLFNKGIKKIAQKVGEEATELVIEAFDDRDDLFLDEAADLFFHYLLLLKHRNFSFEDIESILYHRHQVKVQENS